MNYFVFENEMGQEIRLPFIRKSINSSNSIWRKITANAHYQFDQN